jgi:hypothetical protein
VKSKELRGDLFAILIGAIAALQFGLIAVAKQQCKADHAAISAAQISPEVTK